MRRLPETSEAFARRKAADLARWRRNAEEDLRSRDPRDDERHSRFRDPRRDPRLALEEDSDYDGEDDEGGG
jgi:hypothetical protein